MPPSSTRCRWSPTPEQIMILKELYRNGLTNPNALQIQKLTARLSLYGDIQGKNVFYWFQNHKARDRQKMRNDIAKQLHQQQLLQPHLHQYQCQPLSPAFSQVFISGSAENLLPQGSTGACEETMRAVDFSRDGFVRTDGPDLMTMSGVGPICHCCGNKPPETLELFPLTSPNVKDQETTATGIHASI